jgi:hypothetical protein
MARLGVPVGGRVRKPRAVEDQSAPIPEEIASELGGSIYIVRRAQLRIDQAALMERDWRARRGEGSGQTILPARRGPTMKRWSLDARSEGQSGCSLSSGRWTISGILII